MTLRSVSIWFFSILSLSCLLLLYGVTNPYSDLIEWIDGIAEALLVLILSLGVIFLSTKTIKHKLAVVITGAIVVIATSAFAWYRYIKELKESLEHIKDFAEPKLFVAIGILTIILALIAFYRKPVNAA